MNPFEHISKLRIFCFMGRRIRFGFAFFVRHHLIYIKAVFLWQALGLHFDRFSEPMHHYLCFCTGYDLRLLMWSSSSQQAQACRWEMGSLKFAIGLSLLSYESCRHASFSTACQKPSAFCLSFLDLLRCFTAVSLLQYTQLSLNPSQIHLLFHFNPDLPHLKPYFSDLRPLSSGFNSFPFILF